MRADTLQLPTCDLNQDETARLQGIRNVLEVRLESDQYGGNAHLQASEWMRELMSMALATNRFDHLESDFELALSIIVNSGGTVTGVDAIKDQIESLADGLLDGSFRQQLLERVEALRGLIEQDRWSEFLPAINQMVELLDAAESSDIDAAASDQLHESLSLLTEVATTTWELPELPVQAELRPRATAEFESLELFSEVESVGANETDLFVGGSFTIEAS